MNPNNLLETALHDARHWEDPRRLSKRFLGTHNSNSKIETTGCFMVYNHSRFSKGFPKQADRPTVPWLWTLGRKEPAVLYKFKWLNNTLVGFKLPLFLSFSVCVCVTLAGFQMNTRLAANEWWAWRNTKAWICVTTTNTKGVLQQYDDHWWRLITTSVTEIFTLMKTNRTQCF